MDQPLSLFKNSWYSTQREANSIPPMKRQTETSTLIFKIVDAKGDQPKTCQFGTDHVWAPFWGSTQTIQTVHYYLNNSSSSPVEFQA